MVFRSRSFWLNKLITLVGMVGESEVANLQARFMAKVKLFLSVLLISIPGLWSSLLYSSLWLLLHAYASRLCLSPVQSLSSIFGSAPKSNSLLYREVFPPLIARFNKLVAWSWGNFKSGFLACSQLRMDSSQ